MNKKNLILGGILLILAILAYLYQGPVKQWRSGLGRPDNLLAGLNADDINKIEIKKGEEATTLEKIDGKWKINGTKSFYANDSEMESVMAEIKTAAGASVELASEKMEKKGEFQTDESGTQVKLFQSDNELANFIVGKTGNDYSSTYISLPDSESTFLVKANLNSVFARDDWYDRTIFSVDQEKITKIRFQYPRREFTIEKNEEGWSGTLPYAFNVSAEKTEAVLQIMSALTAVQIPEQIFGQTGLDKNLIIIQATGDGIDNTLMVGEADEDNFYYAKRGDSDNIYLIAEEQKEELDKQISDLR